MCTARMPFHTMEVQDQLSNGETAKAKFVSEMIVVSDGRSWLLILSRGTALRGSAFTDKCDAVSALCERVRRFRPRAVGHRHRNGELPSRLHRRLPSDSSIRAIGLSTPRVR